MTDGPILPSKRSKRGRCTISDRGARCRRLGLKGITRFGRYMCKKHYDRADRKNGDPRHYREVLMMKALERREKLRKMRTEVYGSDESAVPDSGAE